MGTSTRSRTGSGARAARPDSAASRPRSLSTAGCRPRMNSRSSDSASTASSCASAIARRTGSGASAEALPGHAEVHGQRDQPLLRAVVQVALDPAALGVGRGDDVGPAAGQRLDPLRQFLAAARARAAPGPRPRPPGVTCRASQGAASSSPAAAAHGGGSGGGAAGGPWPGSRSRPPGPASRRPPARRRATPMRIASRWNPSCRHVVAASHGPTGHGLRSAASGPAGISRPSVARSRDRCSAVSPCTAHSASTGPATTTAIYRTACAQPPTGQSTRLAIAAPRSGRARRAGCRPPARRAGRPARSRWPARSVPTTAR